MSAVEVIYLVAAILWIVTVSAAVGVGLRVVVKLRARRRRLNGLLDVTRLLRILGLPVEVRARRSRWSRRRTPGSLRR